MNYPHPLIAREGWPFLAGAFVISLLVHASAGFWWALPLWIITVFVLQFFRDPPRPIPSQPNAVLAPRTAASSWSKKPRIRSPAARR